MENSDRIAQEIAFFKDMDLNALPEIYCYWANAHLVKTIFEAYKSYDLFEIFARELGDSTRTTGNPTIISIGSGDAEIDQTIALRMLDLGYTDFHFQCLELSDFLIERAKIRLAGTRVADHFTFVQVDLSEWQPKSSFGACFAHHSLHHIIHLEHVFDQIQTNLAVNGSFLTSDMIGRNGHMRWPETLAIINALWQIVPDAWKHNRPLKRFEEQFVNWDCSSHGFEGIRAQDILPLLVERFHFHRFAAWGGLIDPFIDRAFGHNLDSNVDLDRNFIDTLSETNRSLVQLGVIKPTQMIAVMKNEPGTLMSNDGLIPALCIRSIPTDSQAVPGEEAPHGGDAPGPVVQSPHKSVQALIRRLLPGSSKDVHSTVITGAQSGTWYDPKRNGEGFQVEIGTLAGTRRINVSWQTYNQTRQLWLTGSAVLHASATDVTVPLFSTNGANFGKDFSAEDVQVEPWGTVRLSFSSNSRMVVQYDAGNDVTGTLELQRILDGIEGLPG